MALPNAVINDYASALAAGCDAFMLRPFIDQVDFETELVDISSTRGGRNGAVTAVSLDYAQLKSQRKAYEGFVKRVLMKVVDDIIYLVRLYSNVEIPTAGEMLGYLELPDGFASSDLVITGTPAQVNHVLQKLYYFAPNGTNGDVELLIEVKDTPHFDCVKVPRALTVSSALYSLYNYGNSDNATETATLHSACASLANTNGFANGFANRTIPIRVQHMNQAPEVVLSSGDKFTTKVDAVLTGLGVSVFDIDNGDVTGYTSFGQALSAPISVTLTAMYGKLTLPNRDFLSLFAGRGILDSRISFRGDMSVVNNALSKLQYICLASDGCSSHYVDRISVTVNDDGFYGRGGPMTDQKSVSVSFENQ